MTMTFSSAFRTYQMKFKVGTVEYLDTLHENEQIVILVHGIGASNRYFWPLANLLAESYRVIVVSLPGYGNTPKPKRALDINQCAGVLAEFIAALSVVKPILIGHSMGCQIVTRLAVEHSYLPSKMVLLAPTVNRYERNPLIQLGRLVQDTTRESYALNKILLQDYMKFGLLSYLRVQKYMLNDYIENRLGECLQPTLIVRGQNDDIVPRTWAFELSEILPQGRIAEIDSAPHAVQYSAAKKVAAICEEFINS